MENKLIHSWDELQSTVFEGVWDASIQRYRNNRVFRGVKDRRWDLIPALNRTCKHNLKLEKHILRSFKKYGYADLRGGESLWQLVATGQHYGLPTSLLDWSYSPLVAAHFATEDTSAYDRDGAIIMADMQMINGLLPKCLHSLLKKDSVNVFSQEMLDKVAPSFEKLQALSERPFSLFFEPASVVSRIENQYALFSLSSDVEMQIDLLPHAIKAFTRIIIPWEVKLEIRDKLDYINISERMLYPGLGGVCQWISRRYAPLGPLYNAVPRLTIPADSSLPDQSRNTQSNQS